MPAAALEGSRMLTFFLLCAVAPPHSFAQLGFNSLTYGVEPPLTFGLPPAVDPATSRHSRRHGADHMDIKPGHCVPPDLLEHHPEHPRAMVPTHAEWAELLPEAGGS